MNGRRTSLWESADTTARATQTPCPMRFFPLWREQRKWKPLVLVYVASPFAGDITQNTENAVRYCRFTVDHGAISLAPHLFLPQFISEETEQETAMFMNMVFLGKCEQLWVFGSRITDGMAAEIARAKKRGMPIRYFTDTCEETRDGGY